MRLWYRTGDIGALHELARDKVVCVDVETTGLDPRVDEPKKFFALSKGQACSPRMRG